MPEVKLKVVTRGGDANDGLVDLYDGSTSLTGLARATTIVARTFATQKVITKAYDIDGVKLFRAAPKYSSFMEGIKIEFSDNLVSEAQKAQFYELLTWCFNEAIGVDTPELESPLSKRMGGLADQLVPILQEPLRLMHRPIINDTRLTISIERIKAGPIVKFDQFSAQRFEEDISDVAINVVGSVTRYNSRSGWGRLLYAPENRTISFYLSKRIQKERRVPVTTSLHFYDQGEFSDIILLARPVTIIGGRIKRFLVDDVIPL